MLDKAKLIANKRSELKHVPQTPGVYIFRDDNGKPLYVGKAKNLKSRLSSYLAKTLRAKTKNMVSEPNQISYIEVSSELEALLLEAKLVKKFQPHYNVELRDDKHPLYIVITKENYPRIITARKTEASDKSIKAFYGPFPNSTAVRSVLRMLRRVAPYSQHKLGKRACIYSQIGLCDPCPNYIEHNAEAEEKKKLTKKYQSNIRLIKRVLDGKIRSVEKSLAKRMKQYSDKEKFEEAARVKEQLNRLKYVTQSPTKVEAYIANPNFIEDIRQSELLELAKILTSKSFVIDSLERIECYDVAHLAGVNPTASMVTFINGQAEKRLYRHFKIRQSNSRSDTDSLRETIQRRLKHLNDWGVPDLIIVDGGKPQVSTFVDEMPEDIPVVGLAKRFETIIIPRLTDGKKSYHEVRLPKGGARNLVQRMRDEAHRFSRRYHHKLISRDLLNVS